MKHLLLSLLSLLAFLPASVAAQERAADAFAYPSIPDSITNLQNRYDYYVSHFWDRIDLKKAFSSRQRVAEAFADYVSPMSLASADTVFSSVSSLMKRLEKRPSDQLYIASLAEQTFYADSASMPSDELYVAFINPVVANKKVAPEAKARYEYQLNQLIHSMVGRNMGALRFTDRDGRTVRFAPAPGQPVIIYLFDPECDDCRMARIRLMADARTRDLIDNGSIALLALSAVEPDDQWRAAAAEMPEKWLVGTDPDLDTILDLRGGTPSFYLIDERGVLVAKHLNVNSLLNILSRI